MKVSAGICRDVGLPRHDKEGLYEGVIGFRVSDLGRGDV